MDDRAGAVAVMVFDAQLFHEFAVARGDCMPVDRGGDAVAAELFNVRHAAAVDLFSISLLQAFADGVRGGAFGQRRVFQQLRLVHRVVVDGRDLKHALRQRAGLVEHDDLRLGQGLEIIRALDKNALPARAADTGEEAQRNADDQRARAADDQERQCAVDPVGPVRVKPREHAAQRDQHGQRQRRSAHGGRIDLGKAGDECFGARFAGARVLDQVEDLRHGGLAERLRCADLQNAGHVDAAADDLVTLLDVARQALAGQRAGVETGGALDDHAVERNLFARLDDDDAADRNLVRIDLRQLAVSFDVRVIRANVHQRGDILPALADGVALEQLADLVEQHNGDALDIVAALRPDGEEERAERGQRHKEILVKRAAVENALAGLAQDIIADDQIRGHIGKQLPNAGDGDEVQRNEHHGRDEDAHEHLFLLLCHSKHSRSALPEQRLGLKARSRSPARPFCRP